MSLHVWKLQTMRCRQLGNSYRSDSSTSKRRIGSFNDFMPFEVFADLALIISNDILESSRFSLLEECPQAPLTEARSSRMLVKVFIVNECELLDRDDSDEEDVKL